MLSTIYAKFANIDYCIAEQMGNFILDYCTVLLPYTYKALLAEMCRIGDFKWVGHFDEAKL